MERLVKYLMEGAAVALATIVIPQKKVAMKEIIVIALTASAIFAVLDAFSPGISSGARAGTGFGIGYKLVGGEPEPVPVPEREEPLCDSEETKENPEFNVTGFEELGPGANVNFEQ